MTSYRHNKKISIAADKNPKPDSLALSGLSAHSGFRSRAILLLCAMVFVVSLGYGADPPLILLHLGNVPTSDVAWHIGMLDGVYLFALLLFASLWGRISDRQERVLALEASFVAFPVGSAATALALGLEVVYGARILAGAAAIVPTAQAYIEFLSPTIDHSRRFVLLGL